MKKNLGLSRSQLAFWSLLSLKFIRLEETCTLDLLCESAHTAVYGYITFKRTAAVLSYNEGNISLFSCSWHTAEVRNIPAHELVTNRGICIDANQVIEEYDGVWIFISYGAVLLSVADALR